MVSAIQLPHGSQCCASRVQPWLTHFDLAYGRLYGSSSNSAINSLLLETYPIAHPNLMKRCTAVWS